MRSVEFVRDLCDALGFPRSGVSRIVIVADVREVPWVYVRGPVVAPGKLTAVVGVLRVAAVENVTVADDCTVQVVPLEAVGGASGVSVEMCEAAELVPLTLVAREWASPESEAVVDGMIADLKNRGGRA